jgi:hypothetical protein
MNIPELPPPNWFQKHILNIGWRWETDGSGRELSTLERFLNRYIINIYEGAPGVRVVHTPWFPFKKGMLFIWGDSAF